MYTREIDGKIYEFKFGIGFVRDIDKTRTVKDDDGTQRKVGLTFTIAGLMDGDFEKLIDCLLIGNKYAGGDRLERSQIEAWLEEDTTDLEREFRDLLDFFETANFTSRKTRDIKEAVAKSETLQEAAYQTQIERAKAGTS